MSETCETICQLVIKEPYPRLVRGKGYCVGWHRRVTPQRTEIWEPGNRDKCQEPREVSEGLKQRVKNTSPMESDEVQMGTIRAEATKAEMLKKCYLKRALVYDLLDHIFHLSLGFLCLCVFPSPSVSYALI